MELTVVVAENAPGGEWPGVCQSLAGRSSLAYVIETALSLEPALLVAVVGTTWSDLCQLQGAETVCRVAAGSPGMENALRRSEPVAAGRAGTVLVMPSDVPLIRAETLRRMLDQHLCGGATLTYLTASPPPWGEAPGRSEGGQEPAGPPPGGEASSGIFCFDDAWLWRALRGMDEGSGDAENLARLTAVAANEGRRVQVQYADRLEVTRLDNLAVLAQTETEMRRRINERWMLAGVRLIDPAATYIDAGVQIEAGTVIWPGTFLQGNTRIGRDCAIGPGSVIRDSTLGTKCRVELSVVEGAVMEDGSDVGPFSHLRKGARLGRGAHVGNFGELKNSTLGPGAKMGHFSYLGDATVGAGANIGAGTITCNFDGEKKSPTVIGQGAFIGSDTLLVAPVTVGEGAKTGAGSVVTHDVPPASLAYGVPARVARWLGAEGEARKELAPLGPGEGGSGQDDTIPPEREAT